VTEPRRRLAAIMFTDMVGYSKLAQADEAAALSTLEEHNQLLRPIFVRFSGREIKTVGDAFLVEFESALEAVRCALEIQRALHEKNEARSDGPKTEVRIGVHVGDVVQTDGDVLGDAVNIASRIAPQAEPGGICITQQVYDQVQNKVPTPMVRLPPVVLKNIRVPIAVYRVAPTWEAMAPARPSAEPALGHNLAVLPLSNISPDPKDEYFADGLTEELISVLSQVQNLGVIARTSVAPYKTSPKSIAQVGAELGVDSVLEGSVRKSGNRIRITLQLIDVGTQRHIWASSYNREVDDVFAVQSDIAERTAEALRLELASTGRASTDRLPTANPAAYDLYLRGLVASREHENHGIEEAVRCFEQATQLDPTFAEAFAAWAEMYVEVGGDHIAFRDVMPRARELAARALELDPTLSDAHSALANIAMQFDHDWTRAEEEYRKALELNPSNVGAYRFFGLLLVAHGRFEEAREIFRRGVRLDPGSSMLRNSLGWVDAEMGDFSTAIEDTRRECARNPFPSHDHIFHGLAYIQAGLREDAIKEADRPLAGTSDVERFDHALLNGILGRPEEAKEVIAAVERGEVSYYVSATDLAMLCAAVGENSKALDLLEKDAREGDRTLWLYYRGIYFDPIREDPRFIQLLRDDGLPTYFGRRRAPT